MMTMQLFQHFGYKGLETASQSRLWKLAAVWDPQPREDALNQKLVFHFRCERGTFTAQGSCNQPQTHGKRPAITTKVAPMRLVTTQNTWKLFPKGRNLCQMLQVSRSMDVCPAGWASWRPCMVPQRNALRVNIRNLTLRTRYEAVDSPV